MPYDHRGCYTGKFYVYNDRRPLLGVDVRDLPGLVDDAGAENLEERQGDGTYVSVADILAKAAPKAKYPDPPRPKPKPTEKKSEEVSDGD